MKNKILIVDDDKDLIYLLSQQLEAAGYEVIAAYEGIQAVKMTRQHNPDLIILDWRIPMAGEGAVLEFFSKRADLKHIPIIVLTAYRESEIEEKSKKFNAQAILHKPCDTKVIIEKIRELLKTNPIPQD